MLFRFARFHCTIRLVFFIMWMQVTWFWCIIVNLQSNEENKIAAEYLKNYQKAVFTIHRCWQENEGFARLTKVCFCVSLYNTWWVGFMPGHVSGMMDGRGWSSNPGLASHPGHLNLAILLWIGENEYWPPPGKKTASSAWRYACNQDCWHTGLVG